MCMSRVGDGRMQFFRYIGWAEFWGVQNLHFDSRLFIPPQTVFMGGYTVFTLSKCPSVHPSVRPTDRVSVTFCFFNKFQNH